MRFPGRTASRSGDLLAGGQLAPAALTQDEFQSVPLARFDGVVQSGHTGSEFRMESAACREPLAIQRSIEALGALVENLFASAFFHSGFKYHEFLSPAHAFQRTA